MNITEVNQYINLTNKKNTLYVQSIIKLNTNMRKIG